MLRGVLERLRRRPTAVADRDRLLISYEPRADGKPDPGEVVWTWEAYEEDHRLGKDRPVLVIGRIGRQLAVLPLTSKNHSGHSDCVELGSGAWDSERRVSYVKLEHVLRVAPGKVRREGAALDEARFRRVVDTLAVYAHERAGH